MASLSYQLGHDNQLLLYLHSNVVEMQTKEGSLELEKKREIEKERLVLQEKEYAKAIIEQQCNQGNEQEVLDLLLVWFFNDDSIDTKV